LILYRSIRDPEKTTNLTLVILVMLVNLGPLNGPPYHLVSGAVDLRAHHRSVMCSSVSPINLNVVHSPKSH
jgi:hypothetical protein